MKKMIYASAFLIAISLISCAENEAKKETAVISETSPSDKPVVTPINEADWELKELGETGPDFLIPPFAVKLPKDATIEKKEGLTNTLHLTFKNGYKLSIAYVERVLKVDEKLKGEIATMRQIDIDLSRDYNDIKILGEDENGYSFTSQPMMEGKLVAVPTSHFSYFIENKKGGYVLFRDFPASTLSSEEEAAAYSAENTKKIREIIAGSAAFK